MLKADRSTREAEHTRFYNFGDGLLGGEILETAEGGNRIAKFECKGNFFAALDEVGQMPLPQNGKQI